MRSPTRSLVTVHPYQFDVPATQRFRELIDDYGRMRRLEDMTPQRRGQLFNDFVAELLRTWGLGRVEANVRGVGEVDVVFALEGVRFVLEAKWEQAPVDFGPIAKLSGRINQRFTGTRGVLLSMSGYSQDALHDITRGHQPDMLLLDRTHLEAMLSGLLSPNHLFGALVDRASYRGDIYVPMTELVVSSRDAALPALAFGDSPDDQVAVITETAPGVQAAVVLRGTEPCERTVDGLALDAAGRLLLTLPTGVARIELASGALDWAAPIPECRGNPMPLGDGSILVLHGAAVLRWHQHEVEIVAGGFTGGTSLLRGPDDEVWVFDYKGQPGGPDNLMVTLTRLGGELGQETRHIIDFRAHIWNAVWLSGPRFFLAGDGHFGVVDLEETTTVAIDDQLMSPHPDQRGAIRLDQRTVLTASRHGKVYRIDVENGQSTCLAELDMLAVGCELAAGEHDSAYLLEHRGGPRSFIPIVAKLSGLHSP
jgi:Holliday junction resolvase-like predicted endonuclease